VASATREVIAGRAVFERDSVLFREAALPFPIVGALLRHAMRHDGRLDVVDFGGSLGSVFRQLRWFLPSLAELHWQVVEQPDFVRLGQAEFTTDSLSFHATLDALPPPQAPRLVLLSSSLQYLPAPRSTLSSLLSDVGATTLVIDRTPFSDANEDQLRIQRVPARIYDASYPLWILSRGITRRALAPNWQILVEFPCAEGPHRASGGLRFEFSGLIAERKS
jgi:putative methyltransferase (TIGR04325 family)